MQYEKATTFRNLAISGRKFEITWTMIGMKILYVQIVLAAERSFNAINSFLSSIFFSKAREIQERSKKNIQEKFP